MRILHCIPGMGGGGAERQLAYLAQTLTRSGCDIQVALTVGGPNLDRLRSSGAQIHHLTGRGNHDPRLFLQLRTLIRNLRPQVVHTWLTQMDILGGIAAWKAGIPWVLSERSSAAAYPRTTKHRARELLAAKAAAVISNSSAGDDYWARLLDSTVPRWVIPNGLPLQEIDAALPIERESYDLPPASPLVLFAGRFSEEKNVLGFLQAFRLLPDDVFAVLCGDGPQLQEVRLACEPLSDRVRLVGYTTELWRWLKASDAVVSVSHFEGNPNVVLEAMAGGCPLVVSDIPAHRALLDERSARFADSMNPAAIADGIRDVLTHRSLARQRAAVARSRAESYDITVTAPRFLELYQQLTSPAAMPRAS